jgi:hypothetical protein
LPLATAAEKLGVSPTAIKKACRKLGVFRWPMKIPGGSSAPDLSSSTTKQRTGRVVAPKTSSSLSASSSSSPPPKSSSSEAERAQSDRSKQLNRARTAMQQAPRPALSASTPSAPPSQPAATKKSDKKKAVTEPKSKGAPRRAARNSKASVFSARIEDGRRAVPVQAPKSTIRAWGAAGHGDDGVGALPSAQARSAQNQCVQSHAIPFAGNKGGGQLEQMQQGMPISHQQMQQMMMMQTWAADSFRWQYPAGTFAASNQISLQSRTVGQAVNAASNHAPLGQSRRPPALSTSLFTSSVSDTAVSAAEYAGHSWAHVSETCRSTTSSLSGAPTMQTMGSRSCSTTSSPSCKEGSSGTLSRSQSTSSMASAKSLGEAGFPDSSTSYTLGEGGEIAFSMMQDGGVSTMFIPTPSGNSIPTDFLFSTSSFASSPKMSRQGSFSGCDNQCDFPGLTPRGSDGLAVREHDGLCQLLFNGPSCLLGPATASEQNGTTTSSSANWMASALARNMHE